MKRIGLLTDDVPQGSPAAFVCPHCGKEYKTAAAMKAHVKKEHPDAPGESVEALETPAG